MNQLDDTDNQNQATLASLFKDYDMYDELKLAHDTQVETIKRENKQNLSAYEDEIKSRNTGMEVGQQEGESDEDYAQRMIDTAHTTVDPKQVEIQAQLYLFNTMKDRLGTMIQPYKAEAVLNQIIKVDGYDGLQVIKDRWPSLQKKLTDTFGDLRRVDNTDSIAIFLLDETPVNAIITSSPKTSVPPVPKTPNVTSVSTVPSYSSTTPPSISSYMTKYKNPIEVHALLKPSKMYNPRGISTAPAPYPEIQPQARTLVPIPSSYPVRPTSKPPQLELVGKRKRVKQLTPVDIGYYFQKYKHVRPYPTDLALKEPNFKPALAGKRKSPLGPVGKQKQTSQEIAPTTRITRSSSLKAQSEKLPIEAMTYEELRDLLDQHGLPFLLGNDTYSKKQNYLTLNNAGLLPERPQLEPFSVIQGMSIPHLQQYLDEKGIRGLHGGDPLKTKSRDSLNKMYLRYASDELQGSGISDIKSRFAIVDGEIQAGNNNPQLMRDARKLLKEMVQQKMVSLYEAQSHMKHLRKINKI